MTLTELDLDPVDLARAMERSGAATATEAVNTALHAYNSAASQKVEKHLRRAAQWEAVEDAEARHQQEKGAR